MENFQVFPSMKNSLLVLSLAQAFSFSGQVKANTDGPWAIKEISKDMLVAAMTLDGKERVHSAFVMPDGSFKFESIPDGRYLVSVINSHLAYSQVVADSAFGNFKVYDSVPTGDSSGKTLDTLVLHPRGKMDFFPPKEPFDVFQSLKSPMFLISGGMIALMILLTKLQASLGDENDPTSASRSAEMHSAMQPFAEKISD
jgi:Protein of unknown function (DUF2012)